MEDLGLISDIQRFSVHDGPGIRTTVFMKGCQLECWWCQNPECLNPYPELMTRDIKCMTCGNCANSCPVNAIAIDKDKGRIIDRGKCNRCFECVDICPTKALTKAGNYMTLEEVIKEIEKDEIFYSKSNGGVTVSGGEPLSQALFTHNMLEICKQRGFHTALDTSGYSPWPTFKRVLKHVDLVLYDLKHMDPKLHEKATGESNEFIISNLRKVSVSKETWLRIPLVPGYNDTKENPEKVGKLGREIGVARVSILPFHKLGEGKYKQIGKQHSLGETNIPSRDQLQEIQKFLEGFGLQATIGG